jgi:hypothetical protein
MFSWKLSWEEDADAADPEHWQDQNEEEVPF